LKLKEIILLCSSGNVAKKRKRGRKMCDNDYNMLITALAPIDNDTYDKEGFSKYYNRVGKLLPNVPICVFENWIYRHYSDINDYAFLDFRKMRFEKEIWAKDIIYTEVNSYENNRLIDGLGYHIYESGYSWLQKYMLKHFTWPVPIIVYENNDNHEMGKPFHLLEGHLRTNYFREIYRKEKEKLLESHEVWKVTLS